MGKVLKIHLIFCIRFGAHFSWILISFLSHFFAKIKENSLPTRLRKINEFWRHHFPHFCRILSRFGVPRPGPGITIFHKNVTFYPKMEMSMGILVIFKGLPWFFTISGRFQAIFWQIFHEFLKVSNGFFECFFCDFCNYFWLLFLFYAVFPLVFVDACTPSRDKTLIRATAENLNRWMDG